MFECIDGVWWGQLTCRDATLGLDGPYSVVDLVNAVFYRPLAAMLGFAGAVQAAERARYGSLTGNMAAPYTAEQNDVITTILDRLRGAPTPPPSTHACDGTRDGDADSCFDYDRAWLPITNMEAAVSHMYGDFDIILDHPTWPRLLYRHRCRSPASRSVHHATQRELIGRTFGAIVVPKPGLQVHDGPELPAGILSFFLSFFLSFLTWA